MRIKRVRERALRRSVRAEKRGIVGIVVLEIKTK